MTRTLTVKRLSSNYWLVKWSPFLWIQWPVGRAPTLDDGFGWVTQRHVDAALCAVEGEEESNGPT